MKAIDEKRILYNILARAGGIENIDLHSELAKSLAAINGMSAQEQMNTMQNPAPMTTPQATGGIISPEMGRNTMPPQSPLNNTENTPPGM